MGNTSIFSRPPWRRPSPNNDSSDRTNLFVYLVLISSFLVAIPLCIVFFYVEMPITGYGTLATILVSMILLFFLHAGHGKRAGQVMVYFYFLLITVIAFQGDGIHDVSMLLLPAIILVASLVSKRLGYTIFGLLCILMPIVMTIVRYNLYYVDYYVTNIWAELIALVVIFFMTLYYVRRVTIFEQAALSQAQELSQSYKSIFENIQDVYYEHTIDGIITEISPSGERILGYPRNEMIGKNITFFTRNEEITNGYIQTLLDQGQTRNLEMEIPTTSDKPLKVIINSKLLYDEQGKPMKAVGSLTDISDRKVLEDQFRQIQKMDAVGRLAGGVAHDFNNLLTVITGYSSLLKLNFKDDPENQSKIDMIMDAASKAQALTAQLLAFSRKQTSKPKLCDMNQIIQNSMTMFSRLIGEDIDVSKLLGRLDKLIMADPHQIEQILINLLVNARDAIHAKVDFKIKPMITIETRQMRIDDESIKAHLEIDSDEVIMFSVADNGIGMNEMTKKMIFEPFFTTKPEGEGTGLGLSMVYGAVKQNNGYIDVQSEPMVGTTFKIYWPAASQSDQSTQTQSNSLHPLSGNSECILLVEDDMDVRSFASETMIQLGYRVRTAANAEAALEVLATTDFEPEILMTDIIMPGKNGVQLASDVVNLKPDIKVLLTSGYINTQSVNLKSFDHPYEFLQKPYSIQKLSEALQKLLKS